MTKKQIKIDGKLKEKFTVEDELKFYKQVLKLQEQEYNRLSNLITSTKAYEITCLNCKDAILEAPTISGRTKFSQIEVEEMSLKMIIKQLKDKEQECDQLKAKYKTLLLEHSGCYRKEWVDEQIRIKKIYEEDRQNYWQALQEIKEFVENEMEQDVNTRIILQKCEVVNE